MYNDIEYEWWVNPESSFIHLNDEKLKIPLPNGTKTPNDVDWSDLKRNEDHGSRTLCRRLPRPVPDGVLSLEGEEETRREILDRKDAGSFVLRWVWIKISMSQTDDIVNDGEKKPGEVKACCKHKYAVTP